MLPPYPWKIFQDKLLLKQLYSESKLEARWCGPRTDIGETLVRELMYFIQPNPDTQISIKESNNVNTI